MANIIEVLRKYIRPYYYYIIFVVVLIIFGISGYYAYNKFSKQKNNRFSDVANVNRRNKEAIIYFFHVDWCPHCKKALPEWNSFKSQHDRIEINGYLLKCMDIDCTKETSDITRLINQYKIDSYPSIKLNRDEQTIDFDSKITSTSLDKFVNTMLN